MPEYLEKQAKTPAIPPLPHAKWLKPTRLAWEAFWADPISKHVRPGALDIVETLFDLRDERARALKLVRRQRETTGSTGQAVVSPHAAYMLNLESTIARLEGALGIDPASRAKLHLEEQIASESIDRMIRRAHGEEG